RRTNLHQTRAPALFRGFQGDALPARQLSVSVRFTLYLHVSSRRSDWDNRPDAEFHGFLHHEIKLLAFEQSDGNGEMERRLGSRRLDFRFDSKVRRRAIDFRDLTAKLTALSIEHIDFIANFETQHVAQMPSLIRAQRDVSAIVRKGGRWCVESATSHYLCFVYRRDLSRPVGTSADSKRLINFLNHQRHPFAVLIDLSISNAKFR